METIPFEKNTVDCNFNILIFNLKIS